MTTSRSTKREMNEIEAALKGATARYLALLKAQGAQAKVAEATAKEIAAAKELYDGVVEEQRQFTVAANEEAEAALAALVEFQAQKSEELGIQLNVLPQPAGGSTRL